MVVAVLLLGYVAVQQAFKDGTVREVRNKNVCVQPVMDRNIKNRATLPVSLDTYYNVCNFPHPPPQ
jgi:hypothetical protein